MGQLNRHFWLPLLFQWIRSSPKRGIVCSNVESECARPKAMRQKQKIHSQEQLRGTFRLYPRSFGVLIDCNGCFDLIECR